MRRGCTALAVSFLALGTLACDQPRDRAADPACPTWKEDVQPIVEERCASCHGPAAAAGGYDLSSYLGALGPGSDAEANAIAGDDASEIVRRLDPRSADDVHAPLVDVGGTFRAWVVDCEVAYERSRIHEGGILDPASADFHGQLVESFDWDLGTCARCHGDDFAGGAARASCTSCHEGSPTECRTCHRADLLENGAHAGHVNVAEDGVLRFDDCVACHATPSSFEDPGHVLGGSSPAEVAFGALADLTLEGGARAGVATWNAATATCENVYCHGDAMGDAAATRTRPRWLTGEEGQAACGTCHGLPPSNHAQGECAHCHGQVVGADLAFVNPALHGDGVVQVGRAGASACRTCHGDLTSAAPPYDLDGNRFAIAVGVGAHRSHLEARHRLSGNIACTECHAVPESLDAPGHVDTGLPAEVFPVSASVGALARADGAQPRWDAASRRCAEVYCHGGGRTQLSSDASPSLHRAPEWTRVAEGEAACGSCHGIPPVDAAHTPAPSLAECAGCHESVDTFGNILVSGSEGAWTSRHIDGVLDVR